MGKKILERVPITTSKYPFDALNQTSSRSLSFLAEWKEATLLPKYLLNLSSA